MIWALRARFSFIEFCSEETDNNIQIIVNALKLESTKSNGDFFYLTILDFLSCLLPTLSLCQS
jgi:hypothetical protein